MSKFNCVLIRIIESSKALVSLVPIACSFSKNRARAPIAVLIIALVFVVGQVFEQAAQLILKNRILDRLKDALGCFDGIRGLVCPLTEDLPAAKQIVRITG